MGLSGRSVLTATCSSGTRLPLATRTQRPRHNARIVFENSPTRTYPRRLREQSSSSDVGVVAQDVGGVVASLDLEEPLPAVGAEHRLRPTRRFVVRRVVEVSAA